MKRLKPSLAAFAIALACIGSAHANCLINFTTPYTVVSQSLKKTGFNIKNYEKVCARLAAANVELVIEGEGTVLAGVSVAWAGVTVRDRVTKVHTTDGAGASTRVDKGSASVPTAEAMLALAIDGAINSMDIEAAIATVQSLRKSFKATSVSFQGTSI